MEIELAPHNKDNKVEFIKKLFDDLEEEFDLEIKGIYLSDNMPNDMEVEGIDKGNRTITIDIYSSDWENKE